ncbi:MAG: shikimate dehydrogenase [Pyrinomonadaceae bacterium]
MDKGKICVSVCCQNAQDLAESIRRAEEFSDVIEVRFDGMNTDELPAAFAALDSTKPLLLTYRPKEQGGFADADLAERIEFWKSNDVSKEKEVWLDNESDLSDVLKWPPENIVIRSFHDFYGIPGELNKLFDELSALGDAVKIAYKVNEITECIPLWKILERAKSERKSFIPIAMGEAGKWTRILGLAHGAFMTYASLDPGSETAPGQISARDIDEVYRVKDLNENTGVYGIIGGNTSYSVSPFIHNAAFKAAGLNSVFVPLQVRDLNEFMGRMVKPETREIELNFKGFAVTNPHKQSIMRHLDFIDETAASIGAVNTVKIDNGKFHGYNTDAPGFIEPLISKFGDLNDARVSIFGAGGAARACIYALKQHGADVILFARDLEKASILANEFNISIEELTTDHWPLTTDIIVNTTPLGTIGELENETIATSEQLNGVKFVYDLIYNPPETRLIHEANSANVPAIGGMEMLIAQGAAQFTIWTGLDAPLNEMRDAVEAKLRK